MIERDIVSVSDVNKDWTHKDKDKDKGLDMQGQGQGQKLDLQ